MNTRRFLLPLFGTLIAFGFLAAQPPGGDRQGPPGGDRFGPPGGGERKILKDHDADKNGWLNNDERKAARAALKKDGGDRRGPRGMGGFGRGEVAKPGVHIEPGDVKNYSDKPLYDPAVLRTIFLTFENADWEKELEDFHGTDVDVACTMTVDGKTYPNVGVHFRGMSSYMGVGTGSKRSLNVDLNLADKKQRLYGSKTLNLLNAHGDSSFLSTALYSHIARQHMPAPKANMVRVVINGENWGVYASVQQFDKEFVKENFKTDAGARWKVSGSPGGRGGLEYFGDKVEDYKRIFEIKSKDDPKSWAALINLCRVLKETPADKLEEALKPICDIDGLLWFLALDVALCNSDGYWTRASDYTIYLDPKGKFHFIPHDMNEAFHGGGGPGGGFVMGFPSPGEIMPAFLRDTLKLSDDQKKKLDELQKDTDAKILALLSDEQKKQWKEMKDRQAGGAVAFAGPGGPGGPPDGGPGGPGGGRGGPDGGRGRGGFGGPPGMGQGGAKLDPLVGLTDERKPLRSKVLAVPALKAKYLANIRTIAEKSLDWKTLGPVVKQYHDLLAKEIEADTKKLSTFEAFERSTADKPGESRGRETPLRKFADERRAYLLDATKS